MKKSNRGPNENSGGNWNGERRFVMNDIDAIYHERWRFTCVNLRDLIQADKFLADFQQEC